jgi:ATP-dependent DNA helicase RecG
VLDFCSVPRTREEIQEYIGIEHREYFRKTFLKPLLASGKLWTIPDKPTSRKQKYFTV